MAALISLDEAKRHLLVEHNDRDLDLFSKVEQATDIVLDYLKAGADPDWTDETVPPRVRGAILLVLQSLFDDSAKGEVLAALAGGNINNPVVSMLYRLRDPALA